MREKKEMLFLDRGKKLVKMKTDLWQCEEGSRQER